MASGAEAWSQRVAVEYYAQHRHEVSDLYPSEQVFLPRLLTPGVKVLDVGCAVGGFYNIMRTLQPDIDYTGIDISEPSLEVARKKYPEARFLSVDGVDTPFGDGEFDLVHCTSVLVVEPRYQDVIREMYRVSKRHVVADMRLLQGVNDEAAPSQSSYRIQFQGEDTGIDVPYVVNDADEVVDFFLGLDPRPQAVRATGYFHTVSGFATSPHPQVCMSVFLIEKGTNGTIDTELDLDLPLELAAADRPRQHVHGGEGAQ